VARQHVVPHNGQWAVRAEGATRVTRICDTQAEAFDVGRTIARNQQTELVVHRPDGRIRDSESYGNDPCPPRDKD
jgi:uncharacterized protein YdaT